MTKLLSLLRSTRAATAIEYGLIAALIAVAGIGAFGVVGNSVSTTFQTAGDEMSAA